MKIIYQKSSANHRFIFRETAPKGAESNNTAREKSALLKELSLQFNIEMLRPKTLQEVVNEADDKLSRCQTRADFTDFVQDTQKMYDHKNKGSALKLASHADIQSILVPFLQKAEARRAEIDYQEIGSQVTKVPNYFKHETAVNLTNVEYPINGAYEERYQELYASFSVARSEFRELDLDTSDQARAKLALMLEHCPGGETNRDEVIGEVQSFFTRTIRAEREIEPPGNNSALRNSLILDLLDKFPEDAVYLTEDLRVDLAEERWREQLDMEKRLSNLFTEEEFSKMMDGDFDSMTFERLGEHTTIFRSIIHEYKRYKKYYSAEKTGEFDTKIVNMAIQIQKCDIYLHKQELPVTNPILEWIPDHLTPRVPNLYTGAREELQDRMTSTAEQIAQIESEEDYDAAIVKIVSIQNSVPNSDETVRNFVIQIEKKRAELLIAGTKIETADQYTNTLSFARRAGEQAFEEIYFAERIEILDSVKGRISEFTDESDPEIGLQIVNDLSKYQGIITDGVIHRDLRSEWITPATNLITNLSASLRKFHNDKREELLDGVSGGFIVVSPEMKNKIISIESLATGREKVSQIIVTSSQVPDGKVTLSKYIPRD